jgi:hypothetical protein
MNRIMSIIMLFCIALLFPCPSGYAGEKKIPPDQSYSLEGITPTVIYVESDTGKILTSPDKARGPFCKSSSYRFKKDGGEIKLLIYECSEVVVYSYSTGKRYMIYPPSKESRIYITRNRVSRLFRAEIDKQRKKVIVGQELPY